MSDRRTSLLNALTLATLWLTVISLLWFNLIALSPRSPLNPLPPPSRTATTPPRAAPLPSRTPLPARTATPTLALSQSPDRSDGAAEGPTPSPSPASEAPAPTATRTLNPSGFPFQPGGQGPAATANRYNPAGCAWLGVGGQALDLSGAPVPGLVVLLSGGGLSVYTLTGSKTAYGEAGYEIALGDQPRATSGEYTVQLLTISGAPLSEPAPFDTYADCSRNLVVINF